MQKLYLVGVHYGINVPSSHLETAFFLNPDDNELPEDEIQERIQFIIKKNIIKWNGLDKDVKMNFQFIILGPYTKEDDFCQELLNMMQGKYINRYSSSHLAKLRRSLCKTFYWDATDNKYKFKRFEFGDNTPMNLFNKSSIKVFYIDKNHTLHNSYVMEDVIRDLFNIYFIRSFNFNIFTPHKPSTPRNSALINSLEDIINMSKENEIIVFIISEKMDIGNLLEISDLVIRYRYSKKSINLLVKGYRNNSLFKVKKDEIYGLRFVDTKTIEDNLYE